jgi:hypothetical protein
MEGDFSGPAWRAFLDRQWRAYLERETFMTETEQDVRDRIQQQHGETEHEIGRQVDKFFGFQKLGPPVKVACPAPIKSFPERALRDAPGEAPLIEKD